MRQKLLIVGGAGYLGTRLVKAFKSAYDIVVLDKFFFWERLSDFTDALDLQPTDNVELLDLDIRSVKAWDIKDADIVINLACISNDLSSDLDREFTHSISYTGVMNIIDCCITNSVSQFVHLSSNSIYGSRGDTEVYEDIIPDPLTQYSKLKVEVEHYLEYLGKQYKFPFVTLRPSTLCGYSPRMRLDLVVNIFAHQAWKNKHLVVNGGGQYRPAIHLGDMARIIWMMVRERVATGEAYNCGEEQATVLEMAKVAQGLVEGTTLEVKEDAKDGRSYKTQSDKLINDFNFEYKFSYKEAMEEVINAFETKQLVEDKYMKNITVMKRYLGYGRD